jgi:PIN domain nuclease of toxin-antitoxin system
LRLLLDTHIWLWGMLEPNRIGPKTLRDLRDSANEIWLSPISTWEALLLHAKGKIHLSLDLADWLTESTAGTREAPLTHEIALIAQQWSLHRDPADRFLAATAKVLDLTLVTADERLLGLGNIRTLGNR